MKTSIDWVTFRTKSDPFSILESLLPAFGTAHDLVTLEPGGKGRDGWTWSKDIVLGGDIRLGSIDHGGESQREWVRCNLTGEGCGWVQDWSAFAGGLSSLREWGLRRVDIALTTYRGEVTDSMVVQAHAADRFVGKGRPPELRSVTSTNKRAGTTRYIGSRAKSDKMLRCYEKGREMIKDLPESMRDTVREIQTPDGWVSVDDVYRVELELKAVTQVIPLEVLIRRDDYFASSYPWCADLLPGLSHVTMQKLPEDRPRARLDAMLAHCRQAYGPAIFTAMQVYHGDAAKVLGMIMGTSHARGLVEAGVLTVDFKEGEANVR